MFTTSELEEMRRADAEIEENFAFTNEEIKLSNDVDREAIDICFYGQSRKKIYNLINRETILKKKKEKYERKKANGYYSNPVNRKRFARYKMEWEERNKGMYKKEGEKIKSARENRGWSQAELARRIMVSAPSISKWESGNRKANWAKLCAVMPELMEGMQ